MTDKQIDIVEILAEQCKNCTLYEGDTVSLNISIFDRPLKGICFNNNIYFSVDELNYIMQKLISKEQECKEWKDLANHNGRVCNERLDKIDELEHNINELNEQLDRLKAENDELRMKNRILETECNEMRDVCNEFEQYYELLMEEHNKLKQTLTEIKEIAEKNLNIHTCAFKGCGYDLITNQILQKISEVEE